MTTSKLCVEALQTERLILRMWRQEDFDAYATFYSDEANAKYVGGLMDSEQSWRSMALQIGHWQLKGFGYWAVEEKSSGDFVGCVGLWQSPGWPEVELGYWVTADHQGKGYAFEAAARSLAFAREVARPPSLVSYIDPANTPSIRLAEKLGASYEETIELHVHGPHGVYRHF